MIPVVTIDQIRIRAAKGHIMAVVPVNDITSTRLWGRKVGGDHIERFKRCVEDKRCLDDGIVGVACIAPFEPTIITKNNVVAAVAMNCVAEHTARDQVVLCVATQRVHAAGLGHIVRSGDRLDCTAEDEPLPNEAGQVDAGIVTQDHVPAVTAAWSGRIAIDRVAGRTANERVGPGVAGHDVSAAQNGRTVRGVGESLDPIQRGHISVVAEVHLAIVAKQDIRAIDIPR